MMWAMAKTDPSDVGRRLRAIMVELGYRKPADFAAALDIVPAAVSNWMSGYNLPKLQTAAKLVELIPDLTLDWIYLGDEARLPRGLADRLRIRVIAFEQGLEVPVVAPDPVTPKVRAVRPRPRACRKMGAI